MMNLRKYKLAIALGGSVMILTACDPSNVSVGGGVYYDSVLWNDYYYHDHDNYRPPPPGVRPPPGTRPPGTRPPTARPLPARPPIHRPTPRRR